MKLTRNSAVGGHSRIAIRAVFATLAVCCIGFAAACAHGDDNAHAAASAPRIVAGEVEAACGQCRFGLTPPGCDLAVRIDGVAYFVDGTKIDEHGDAHAADGFCNAVRRARVVGHVADGRFVAEDFVLLPPPAPLPASSTR